LPQIVSYHAGLFSPAFSGFLASAPSTGGELKTIIGRSGSPLARELPVLRPLKPPSIGNHRLPFPAAIPCSVSGERPRHELRFDLGFRLDLRELTCASSIPVQVAPCFRPRPSAFLYVLAPSCRRE